MLQGYLDLCAAVEPKREQVIDGYAVIRTHHLTECTRNEISTFGEVTVKRMGYSMRAKDSVFLLDAQLNLPRDIYGHSLRQRVGEEVAKSSFLEALCSKERSTLLLKPP